MSKLTKMAGWFFAAMAFVSAAAQGQQPKPIEKVQGVTGRFQVTMTERSPLSNPAEIVKRFAKKPATTDPDYDLSKEIFEAFVPKSPGDDGKYGLMVPMPLPAHGFPPAAWLEVLEKHHLIWLGDQNGGPSQTASIGLALDAVHNAEKAWPIDPNRVYICPGGTKSFAQGIALYYPEIFQGQLCSAVGFWFDKVSDSRSRNFLPGRYSAFAASLSNWPRRKAEPGVSSPDMRTPLQRIRISCNCSLNCTCRQDSSM